MSIFGRLLLAVLVSGLVSGLVMAAIQQWRIVPLILVAETYERAEAPATAEAHSDGHSHAEGAQGAAEQWAPADGLERNLLTLAADLFAAFGFAFLVGGASLLSGFPITAKNGFVWGLAGFVVFQLAPALGLPPELPGMPSSDLMPRQLWWLSAAAATAAGIYVIARFRNYAALGVGAVLVLAPQFFAPPVESSAASAVPAVLASQFASAALFTGLVFWLTLGTVFGWYVERFPLQR